MSKIIEKLRKNKTCEEYLTELEPMADTLRFIDEKGRFVFIDKEAAIEMIKKTSFWREDILEGINELDCPFCKSRVEAVFNFIDLGVIRYSAVCPNCQYQLLKDTFYNFRFKVETSGNKSVYCQLCNTTLAQIWNNSKKQEMIQCPKTKK